MTKVETEAPKQSIPASSEDTFEKTDISSLLNPDTFHLLVYEYLIHNCYGETAKSFGTACRLFQDSTQSATSSHSTNEDVDMNEKYQATKMDEEGDMEMEDTPVDPAPSAVPVLAKKTISESAFKSLEPRKAIFKLINRGKIMEAIQVCNSSFPAALTGTTPQSVDICFQLECQQFIENIRVGTTEAYNFARDELGRFVYLDAKYRDLLKDVIALLAYPDPETSPLSHYLSQTKREELALLVNSYLLAFENLPSQTSIEKITRQISVVHDYLGLELAKDTKKKINLPKWDMPSFVRETCI